MKTNYKVYLAAAIMLLLHLTTGLYSQQVITQWTFEGDVITPSTGQGTASLTGGTTATFATGNPGRAWNTTTYPAQGTNSGLAGVQFLTGTTGYEDIIISFDHRASGTASRWSQLMYTLDGGSTWQIFEDNQGGLSPHDTFYSFEFDLSAIGGANDNPGFGVRIVSIFSPFAFNQNATLSYGPDEAYMRANADAKYQPTPGVGTGNYASNGTWRFDNVTISGTEITGGLPVKLAITNINGGIDPTVNLPFSVTVQAQDADGLPSVVNAETAISLSKETGTGVLGGTLTGVIPSGSNQVVISGVTYNVVESGVSIRASATSGMALAHGISQPFTVVGLATHLAFVDVPAGGNVGQPIATFKVEARRADNTVDNTFTGTITINKDSGPGNLSGTVSVAAVQGVATFNNVSFDQSGSYILEASAEGLDPGFSSTIVIYNNPTIEANILPQFINGNFPGDNRIPFAFSATFTNLIPNATYRYINQAVVSSDLPTANGAGNPIFVNLNGNFYRSTGPSFTSPGNYGEFTTGANGSYTGWFIIETTGNERFAPGNEVFMRIRINNGAGGTAIANLLTVDLPVKVIGYSQEASQNFGTAFRAVSDFSSKNFALLYDNTSKDGRPLFGTSIEVTGINYSTIAQFAAFYKNDVYNVTGAFGGILPNLNPNGVRLIEERSLTDGTLVNSLISPDGIWGITNTVNPTGGLDDIMVFNLSGDPAISVTPASLSGFTYVVGAGPSLSQSYDVAIENFSGSGEIEITAPANYEISEDNTLFSNELILDYVNGVLPVQPQTIFVRLKAGLEIGAYNNELIVHTSGLTIPVNVVCNGTVTPPLNPVITVTSPNGGESWEQGSAHAITWSSQDFTGNVSIYLLKGQFGISTTLIENIPNSGSWLWQIPVNQVIAADYKIRIKNASAATPVDNSNDYFSVIAPIPFPNVKITEISYNPPESGTDILEYIEIYNPDAMAHNLSGWQISKGVVYTFPNISIQPGEYLVIAVNAAEMLGTFGVNALQWTSGALSNSGEELEIKNAAGEVVDYVWFKDVSPWPKAPDGYGPSLALTDLSLDNSLGESWGSETTFVTINADGIPVYGTPGAPNFPQPAQSILIPEGWGGISTYTAPIQPSVVDVMQNVVNDLVILQNFSQLYLPSYGVNSIGNWNNNVGYQLKINAMRYLVIYGEIVTNKTVNLNTGWNGMPVLSECEVDLVTLFAGHTGIIFVKDMGSDEIYWPEGGVLTLTKLLPGKAYYIKVEGPVNLTFPECNP